MKRLKYSKALILTVVLVVIGLQSNLYGQNEEAIKRAKQKYFSSIRYNDFGVATNAIYDLMTLEPNNASYLDSLAFLYYESNRFASAALVSNDILRFSPNNKLVLQVGAKSLEKIGAIDQSLKMYEKLYTLTDDPYTLYEIIQKQYFMKMYADAKINSELLLGKPVVDRATVYAQNENGNEIEIPFRAAILNMQGLIERAQGNEDSAKKYFNNALKIAPEYALAKENLNPKKE
ncbi:hypothetical protein [Marivirga sp.]|uniref:hypothetical protein n=1 Tax=Marivirga sp. TaxID=2018662 RepID=UPI002D80C80A|nr:hypothetical protein [Marivirga sp.]HET8859348.1 hypothetical protein [Marivirga sp.]